MPSSANSMIAGAGGGLVASVATCPLDVIKTRLQAQQHAHGSAGYLGVVATARAVLKHDGIRGLYRGLGPTLLGYLPTWAIYFAVYDGIKSHFGEKRLEDVEPVRHVYPAAQAKGYQPVAREHPWSLHILSAMTAGATSTICTNPLWVIKTRFMTQPFTERRYRHTLDAAATIYRAEGIRAFFRGLLPSLFGIFHVAVQFPLYEQLKTWARRNSQDDLTPKMFLACSAVSKMTASVTTYPHEVVRTRLQTLRRPRPVGNGYGDNGVPNHPRVGIMPTVKDILRHEGWRGLYKGLSVNLVRTVPNSAVTMLTYEMLIRYLEGRPQTS
ncbi:mitochondrial carrier [Wolfiporia cocos MD-104 SS10]|uniref:Mitochondrial carrier n=1 Tax=Wolfiporia cocos (strain MD-104) TaxID=742152 RepID=A0A2H3JK85_WOLCO|nr:mitochondrial carrier [Wolfiporia cocos MD-104 SS10]